MASHYPIAAVARLTGLPVDTLRAWERRYNAVTPVRDHRGRLYSARDVARLKQLAALVAEGHAIGRVAGLSDAALRHLRDGAAPPAAAAEWPGLAAMRQALVRYDLDLVETTLNRHALVLPPHELIFGVVLPLLRDVGDRWEAGAICPAQEHLLSNVVRNVLGSLLRALFRSTAPGGRIVFATPAGQCHELGLLCAAVLAAGAGRAVVYLGADLPASDITHAVTRTKASTVVLANTVATPPADDVGSLKRLPAGVGLLVGGAHAAALKQHLGARAQVVPTLDAFRQLL